MYINSALSVTFPETSLLYVRFASNYQLKFFVVGSSIYEYREISSRRCGKYTTCESDTIVDAYFRSHSLERATISNIKIHKRYVHFDIITVIIIADFASPKGT